MILLAVKLSRLDVSSTQLKQVKRLIFPSIVFTDNQWQEAVQYVAQYPDT